MCIVCWQSCLLKSFSRFFRYLSKQSFVCSNSLKLVGPSPARFTCLLLDSSLAWVKQKDTWQRLWAPGSRKSGCSQGSKIEGSLKWPIYWESSRNIFQICGSDQIIRYFWKCHKKRNHLRDAGIYYMDVSETGIFAQMSALMGKMMETVVKHDQSQ